MLDVALTRDEVDGEAVEIWFLPVQYVEANLDQMVWEDNSKIHDPGGIWESVLRHGMIDPGKWDDKLNGGKGGIQYGNGRTVSIVKKLAHLERSGGDRPRGIPVRKSDGAWCIPIKFGVNATSESEAIAGAIDHNNLVAGGGDSSVFWDKAAYMKQLKDLEELHALPVTIDDEALKALEEAMAEEAQGQKPPPKPSPSWNLTVVCRTEDESLQAAEILQLAGFKTK